MEKIIDKFKSRYIGVNTRFFRKLLMFHTIYSKWIHFEPKSDKYQECTIIKNPAGDEFSVYLKKQSWKNEIDASINFVDVDNVISFLLKNKVRQMKLIAEV